MPEPDVDKIEDFYATASVAVHSRLVGLLVHSKRSCCISDGIRHCHQVTSISIRDTNGVRKPHALAHAVAHPVWYLILLSVRYYVCYAVHQPVCGRVPDHLYIPVQFAHCDTVP